MERLPHKAWQAEAPAPHSCCAGFSCDTPVLSRCFFRGCFGGLVNALDRRYALAEFHVMTVRAQDQFESGDDTEHVGEIEIAEVRHAEDLAFHASLPVGDNGPEAFLEPLHDGAGIETRRGFHR